MMTSVADGIALSNPELEALFSLQAAARWEVARSTAAQRVAKLKRLKAELLASAPELSEALLFDLRKSPVETEISELQPVLLELNDAIANTRRWMKPRRVGTPLLLFGTRSQVRYEPKGVSLILGPWNYPLYMILGPLIGAVAAGNCVVIKPSEKAPAMARYVGELLARVFDRSEVAVVEGDASVATALLALPFDHIFFTGSTRVGKLVMAAAAKNLASVTLELGGKSPAIVDETANIPQAAERIAWGKFINAGQTCAAPDYVLVHRSKTAEFNAAISAAIARFYGPTEEARATTDDFCRIVDDAAWLRLRNLLDGTLARGGRLVIGGESRREERYIAPTVVLTDGASPIMGEEIFGPVLPVIEYDSLDAALEGVRRRDKPLSLYLFTAKRLNIDRILTETSAGGTSINTTLIHLVNPNLPFGGVGGSGLGNYHGEFGFRAFSHERAVLRQTRLSLLQLFFPPYGKRVKMVARLATKIVLR